MNQFVTAADVRTFANISGTSGRYSDGAIGSNILAAQEFISRETNRQFAKRDSTALTFTTEGRAGFAIPDIRSASSVVWDGATLTEGSEFDFIPDARQSGVYVAIQLRPIDRGGKWYYSNSEWWDRGLDLPRRYTSDENDLVITGDWGWDPLPYDLLHAVKAMAAWYIKRSDGLLAGAVQGPDGAILDYSQMPTEVTSFINAYRRGTQASVI